MRGLATKILAAILAATGGATAVSAQVCKHGDAKWVTACDRLNTVAEYGSSATESCTYNPPPGWVIVEHKVNVHSSNNGSRSVSTVAGGSNFASERDVRVAFNRLDEIAAEYTDAQGGNRFKAALQTKFSSMLYDARRFAATHNTLQATVSASGHGNFFDRKRGWEDISVEAHLYCLAPPDPASIERQVARDVGLVAPGRLELVNGCSTAVEVALSWRAPNGEWRTDGWWRVGPGASVAPTSLDRRIATANHVIYYYAKSVGDPPSRWSGSELNEKDRTLTVRGQSLRFRYIALRPNATGDHHLRLTCAD